MRILYAVVVFLTCFKYSAAQDVKPKSTDPDVVIELYAEHPLLVTPTGLAIDDTGRVFVGESHTHFRPDGYDGPQADRILILKDTDGDGKADGKTVFHEGFTHIMDLAFHQDGSLYVATRKDIHRMQDTDGDDKADEVTRIINLETKGDYPHNGISGLAFHVNGRLSFGLGENLGADYAVVGTDGKRFTGGGEGGSTYQVDADGKNLHRVSTGWWNPFGMCVDAFDRVFGTDNDPGASPPCRLIQVIEGGDYGYEYRYGRTGLHPLISWTGSNPGNLPMIAGTGEAPCSVLAYESDALPEKYLGRLLVASWADHRIEHYKITQPKDKGLVTTEREILIEAENEFRPVDLAIHPDGTVYVTDWVSSSYTLHKQGRVWRIRPKKGTPKSRAMDPHVGVKSPHHPLREQSAKALVAKGTQTLSQLLSKYPKNPRARSAIMQAWASDKNRNLDGLNDWLNQETDVRLQQLGVKLLGERGLDVSTWAFGSNKSVQAAAVLFLDADQHETAVAAAVNDGDPRLFHAGVMALSRSTPEKIKRKSFVFSQPHAAILAVRRMPKLDSKTRHEWIKSELETIGVDNRFVAIKWIADDKLKELRPELLQMLNDDSPFRQLDYRLFRSVAAALDRLDGKKPSDHPSPEFLLDRLNSKNSSAGLLMAVLREIDPTYKKLRLEHLMTLLSHEDSGVRLEAIRTLARHSDPTRFRKLIKISDDDKQPAEHRAAAIAGLADGPGDSVGTLMKIATGKPGLLRDEARRSLFGVKLSEADHAKFASVGVITQSIERLLGGKISARPDVQNLDPWKKIIHGKGDPRTGERIFFGTKVGTCSKCHQIDGRGTAVGPDLTQIARRLESQDDPDEWLLKTILRPSEDMAPQYTPWIIVTKQGKTLTGLPRRKGGNAEAYLGIDGKEFSVKKPDIEFHKESDTSIMPKDLLQNLTDDEIRDLFAFLKQSR